MLHLDFTGKLILGFILAFIFFYFALGYSHYDTDDKDDTNEENKEKDKTNNEGE